MRTPKTIKKHRHSKVFSKIWNLANAKDDMFTAVICGRRGAGKSRTLVEMARILDRKTDDTPRFKMENVCFSPQDFADKLVSNMPRGTVIILDDAGIALYSKEALTKIVRRLGKILQSIRTKHYIILMSLPMFKMLEGHTRLMTPVFLDIVGRDEKRKQNLVKFQNLDVSTFTGDIYRRTLTKKVQKKHYLFDLPVQEREADTLRIDKPPKPIDDDYERHKEAFLRPWREEEAKAIKREAEKAFKVKKETKEVPELVEETSQNPKLLEELKDTKGEIARHLFDMKFPELPVYKRNSLFRNLREKQKKGELPPPKKEKEEKEGVSKV